MQMKRNTVLCNLSLAVSMVLAAPAAFAGEEVSYERIQLQNLQAGETYGELIVKYRDGSTQRSNKAALMQSLNKAASSAVPAVAARSGNARVAALQAKSTRRLAVGAEVVTFSRKLDRVEAETLMRQIAADPSVLYVEPVLRMKALATPTDPRWAEQWNMKVPTESAGGINLPPALDKASGEGVVVAVLDTGVAAHPDLDGNVLLADGYDFFSKVPGGADPGDWEEADQCERGSDPSDSSWHGTHVAGTVAALTNNGEGVASVAPDAVILPVRVLGPCGGDSDDIADAIMWASGANVAGVPTNAHPAEIINMSLGGVAPAACPNSFKEALKEANNRGVTVVVAAGNDDGDVLNAKNTKGQAVGYTMGNCSNDIIVVGGNGPTGVRGGVSRKGSTENGFGSSWGTRVDLSAPMGTGWRAPEGDPGSDQVLSTLNSGKKGPGQPSYAFYYGTSMASPHVAGVVALMQSAAETKLTPAEVKEILKSTARPFPQPVDKAIGVGILDADAALTRVIEGPCDPEVEDCAPPAIPLQNGQPLVGLAAATGAETVYSLEVPAGAKGPLSILTSGGSGDVTMYVSFGKTPSAGDAEFTSARQGNSETVRLNTLRAGTYFIKLVGTRGYKNVRLQARYN